jgi:hypothetical protein
MITDPTASGGVVEAKLIPGIDDHSHLSVVEQRYRAVLAVERGEPKIVVVAQIGISRQTLHT